MKPPKIPLDPKKPLDDNDAFRLGLLTAEDMLEGDDYDFGGEPPAPLTVVSEFSPEEIEAADFESVVEAIELANLKSGDAAEKHAPLIAWEANPAAYRVLDDQYKADPGYVESLLLRLEGVRGLKDAAKRLRGDLKRRAKENAKAARLARRGSLRIAEPNEKAGTLGELFDREWPELYTPPGWVLGREGIKKQVLGPEGGVDCVEITEKPVLITGIAIDLESGFQHLHLEWVDAGAWKTKVVKKSSTQDRKEFVELINFGCPVASHNVVELSRFLSNFESKNDIPRCYSTKKMGWLKLGEERVFLCGQNLITKDGIQSARDLKPAEWTLTSVYADYDGEGDQIAAAMSTAGTWEEWKSFIEREVLQWPVAMVGLYASLAAPFLEFLPNAPNAIIDFSGTTTTGKTIVSKIGASAWGNPEEGALIKKWGNTDVGVEGLTVLFRHLPTFLDDTKTAEKTPELMSSVCYQVANRAGKVRGNKSGGLQKSSSCRTVLISTGEAPLNSFGKNAGAKARALCVQKLPFGEGENVELAKRLESATLAHHGHAGPKLIEYLLANPELISGLQIYFDARTLFWSKRFKSNATGRIGSTLALLELGKLALHEYLGVAPPKNDPIEFVFNDALENAPSIDVPRQALEYACGFALQNPTSFYGRGDFSSGVERAPRGEWYGRWNCDPDDDRGRGREDDPNESEEQKKKEKEPWDAIYFSKKKLTEVLADGGYKIEEVIRVWKARDWLKTSDATRTSVRRVIAPNTGKAECIGITRNFVDNIMGS